MTKRIDELTNQELDYLVAKSLGWVNYPEDSIEGGDVWHVEPDKAPFGKCMWRTDWTPSVCWNQCGPLIEQFKLVVSVKSCYSTVLGETFLADTAQQAICKAVIAQEIGHIINEEMK